MIEQAKEKASVSLCERFFETLVRNQRLTFSVCSVPLLWKSCGEWNSMLRSGNQYDEKVG